MDASQTNVTDLKAIIIINAILMDKHAPFIRIKRGLSGSMYVYMYVHGGGRGNGRLVGKVEC